MTFVEVIPATTFADQTFTYKTNNIAVTPGSIVKIELGKKNTLGLVKKCHDSMPEILVGIEIKLIDKVLPLPRITPETIDFIEWVAKYNVTTVGAVLKMMLCIKLDHYLKNDYSPSLEQAELINNIKLSDEQLTCCNEMPDLNRFSVTLLDGVTGSGKTSVYLNKTAEVIKQKKQVLILLPEILLASQLIQAVHASLNINATEWHSGISPKQKKENFHAICTGKTSIIVGTRSALFLPYLQLGMIIVDEEHDSSFKQEEQVIYNARDMSIAKGKFEKLPVILSSATPSLETMHNVAIKKFKHIKISKRYGSAELPIVSVIDMRQDKSRNVISKKLYGKINEKLNKGQQVALFLNRRGYAPVSLCSSCGEKIKCINCSVNLIEHRKEDNKTLLCHHCGYSREIPTRCMKCDAEDSIIPYGLGIQKLQEEIEREIKDIKIAVVSSDTKEDIKSTRSVIQDIIDNKYNIIIGTQIIAKGHNFPKLTLVGIIETDLSILGGDLRATEKTYQLLSQMSGRPGRSIDKGEVSLQTYNPISPIVTSLLNYQRDLFYENEYNARRATNMPPFSRLISIIVSSSNKTRAQNTAESIVKLSPTVDDNISIIGPAPASIYLLRGKYRFRILVRLNKGYNFYKLIKRMLSKPHIPSTVKIKVDIDPISFI